MVAPRFLNLDEYGLIHGTEISKNELLQFNLSFLSIEKGTLCSFNCFQHCLTFLRHTSQCKPICNLYYGYEASSTSDLSGRRTVYSNQALFSSLEQFKLFICLILDGTLACRSNASNKVTHTFSNVFGQQHALVGSALCLNNFSIPILLK